MYKVVIADDERIECIALERKLLELFPEIEVLPEALDGISLIQQVEQHKPDIAIVDINMPGLNGLEAIDIIRMRKSDIKIIIHSAYSDFSYSQKAMQLGAIDYILKPAKKSTLEQAVKKAITQLDAEKGMVKTNEETQKMVDEMQEIVKHEIMMSVLLGSPDEKAFTAFLRYQNRSREEGIWVVMHTAEKECSRDQILAISEAMMNSVCLSLLCDYQNLLYFYLLPVKRIRADNYQEWLHSLLELLAEKISEETGMTASFGCSSWKYQFEQSPEALRECRMALQSIQGCEKIMFYHAIEKVRKTSPFLPEWDALSKALKDSQESFWISWLTAQFQLMQNEKLSLGEVQMWVMDFLMELQRHMLLYDSAGFIRYDYLRYWKEIRQKETTEDIYQWLLEVMKHESALCRRKNNSRYVENCFRFIQTQYQNDISLEEAAKNCGISSFYMTRLLRQEIDRTFIEILTDVRIKNAVSLLKEGKLSIKEVGCAVGYPNTIYFHRVFKKSIGMTIGKMKEFWERE